MATLGEFSDQSLKLSATACSDRSPMKSPRHPSIETRVCLVDKAAQNEQLIQALKRIPEMEVLVVEILSKDPNGKKKYRHSIATMSIDIPYLTSKDGSEYADSEDPHYETVFVLEEFEGEIFHKLKHSDNRVLGSPVVMHVASTNEPLPYTYRPQYCSCMQGLSLCFTNFKTKEHLTKLITLCHYMGACIKKDISAKIDFLVTNKLHGPKFRTAVSLGIPVMREDWVHMCWASRQRHEARATNDEFVIPCKSKPFEGCVICFLGFSDKECKHMQEQAAQQGAKAVDVCDDSCTHLVIDEDNVKSLPFQPHERLFVVIQEWFWGSIQIESRADESMYFFEIPEQKPSLTRSSTTSSLLGTPHKWRGSNGEASVSRSSSSSKHSFRRKRSRMREETLAKLAQDSDRETGKPPPTKRQSTDTSAAINESLLDISNNATAIKSPISQNIFKGPERKLRSKRTNPLSQKRFELKEFRSPGLGKISIDTREKGGEERKKTPTDGVCKQIERLERKRKSSEFETDLSIASPVQEGHLSIDVTDSAAKRIKRGKANKRYSFQFTQSATKFFRRLSSGGIFQSDPESEKEKEEFNTIIEENDSKRSFDDLDLELAKSEETANYLDGSFSEVETEIPDSSAKKSVSARFQVAMELLQTERNYVGILNTILNIFKKPLEDPRQAGGPILPSENIKAIFGSLPEINNVHMKMVADLSKVMETWGDSSCIGSIIDKYAKEFVRCYPPFVNFFEMSKETISSCESSMPRFYAFLKINQSKKECGRQTLAELLINPVQRLPRIILLLQDIKKHTERENANHPDVAGIQAALDAVKEVLTHINEDKRKTESQKQIFDIVYEVDGCPPTVVSSHRQFIARAELIAVDDNLTNKGDHVCLFIFTDCVELAKRKRGVKTQSFKSPSVHTRSNAGVRCLKHIKLLSLSHIKKVVDIKNSDDCQSAFSLFCRTPTDTQDWLYTFKMLSCTNECGNDGAKDHEGSGSIAHDDAKNRLLQLLARHRANTVCKTSDDNFIHTLAPQELDVCTSDISSTLGRAVRAAKKSHKKLTRAFSFSRTPRRVVQRAVSTMMSPASQQGMDGITPGLGTTPSRARPISMMYNDGCETPETGRAPSSSGLTPGMSVSNLCTPHREWRGSRLSSTESMQVLSHTYVINGTSKDIINESAMDESFDVYDTDDVDDDEKGRNYDKPPQKPKRWRKNIL